MAKFVYRMQNILNIKLKLEEQAKNTFAVANAKLKEEQMVLQELILRRAGYERRLKDMMDGTLNIKEINSARKDVNDMKTLVRRQMGQVHKAEIAVNDARRNLNKIMIERKTQEKLKERAFEDFQKELLQAESKEIDELVSYKYNSN